MSRYGYLIPLSILAGALLPAPAADVPFAKITVAETSPQDPWMKIAGDFTGDGFPDIAVCGATGPLLLYAYPDWKKSTIAAAAASQSGSVAADIDKDGDIDILVGTDWFANPGPALAASGPWESHSLGEGGTHDIVAGDVDKDGKLDFAMRGEATHNVQLFRQVSPTSWIRKDIPYSLGYNGLALGDVDKDGDSDLVVPGAWLENPGGDFASGDWAPHAFGAWDDFAAIQTGDVNGDGYPDIVLTYSESAGKISWFQGSANPKSGPWNEHVIDAGPLTNAHSVAIADIDRDGDPDVITSEYEGDGRLLIYLNNGKAAAWTRQVVGTGKLHNIRLADIGKDGDLDIIGAYAWGVNPVVLWRNDLPAVGLAPRRRPERRPASGPLWEADGKKVNAPPAGRAFRMRAAR